MSKLSDRDHSPAEIRRRLDCFVSVARQIYHALQDGSQFVWNGTEGEYNVQWAAEMGLTLITETQVKKRGYRLKRGVKPVGWRYFGAPISKQRALYVLECQAVRVEEKKP